LKNWTVRNFTDADINADTDTNADADTGANVSVGAGVGVDTGVDIDASLIITVCETMKHYINNNDIIDVVRLIIIYYPMRSGIDRGKEGERMANSTGETTG